jgi:hypothetical protein
MKTPTDDVLTPLDSFSNCHEGIVGRMRVFGELPALQEAALRARNVARQALELMDEAVPKHHADEENELFAAVLRSACPGAEREDVSSLVSQLTREHREIESRWKMLRPDFVRAAAGKPAALRQDMVDLLFVIYRRHARLEEREFLPLAQRILARDGNHMAALGMALHLRHAPTPAAYI